jgi:hypothetical protein
MMGVQKLLTAVGASDLGAQIGATADEVAFHRTKFIIRGVLYLAILVYLFRQRVLSYFGVVKESPAKALLKLAAAVGLGVLIWSLGTVLAGV